MSGPKISLYNLTPQMRENVLSQLRCEREAVVCAKQIEGMLAGMGGQREALDKLLSVCEMASSRGLGFSGKKDQILEMISRMEKNGTEARGKMLAIDPKMSAKYVITEEELAKKKKQAEEMRLLKESMLSIAEEIDSFVREAEKEKKTSMAQVRKAIGEELSAPVFFEYMEDEKFRPDAETLSAMKLAAGERLHSIADDKEASAELRKGAAQAVCMLERLDSVEQVKSFLAVTLKPLESRANAYREERERLASGFRQKTELYRALCAAAETDPKDYTYAQAPEMEEQIACLEQELIRRHEQAYISECVDEVMSEMGYDLIGAREVVKRSGKRFRNELYDFGDGTAVNVTYSSDGQIAMELGGVAREDRLPTAEEADVLTEEMERFCGEFAVFEKKLRAKGIIVGSRIAHMQPSAEYAAIINVNDYDVRPGVRVSGFGFPEERRRIRTRKVMRRDE